MDKDRKMRCKVCIKEIVFGYVDPNKDYILCENCAFKDEGHSTYYEKIHKLNNLATRIEMLLNQRLKNNTYEIKVYTDKVAATCDWDWYFGCFGITPNKDGGYTVEDEYYVERFDTIQQIVDYLVEKDNDNAR